MQHELKSWPHFFQAIWDDVKRHDLRDMRDRKFKVGDTLLLREYDPNAGSYTGRQCIREVSFITSEDTPCALSSAVLGRGFCILSLSGGSNEG